MWLSKKNKTLIIVNYLWVLLYVKTFLNIAFLPLFFFSYQSLLFITQIHKIINLLWWLIGLRPKWNCFHMILSKLLTVKLSPSATNMSAPTCLFDVCLRQEQIENIYEIRKKRRTWTIDWLRLGWSRSERVWVKSDNVISWEKL